MTTRKLGRTLLVAVLALSIVLSITGGTIAWFTDEVTSAGNTIEAGTLNAKVFASDDGENWAEVTTGSAPLFNYDKWEPGYTTYKFLKIENAGSLAFKFQLNIKADSAVTGDYKLADVIDVYKAKSAPTGRDSLGEYVGTLTSLTDDTNGAAYGVLEAGDVTGLCIVLKMQESADNNYQGLSVGEGFSLQLLATQATVETDGFGIDYDKDAGYGVDNWNGDTDDSWMGDYPAATEYVITTAEQLADFAAKVNDGTSFRGKTIKLGNNIDLANRPWTPIGNWDDAFEGTFDGQGYTISNLYINDPTAEGIGLFGVAQNATIKGIKVNNVNITGYSMVATIVGSPYTGCTISDCHVTGNVKLVADWAYVGGVVGYGYTKIENCSVIATGTGTITSKTRNAVGGIAAWLLEDASSIKNCQVKNLDLTGWANIGAITGFVHQNNVINGCTAENINLTKTRGDGIATIGLASGGWSYNATKPITITNNTFKNITLNGTYVANVAADILYGGEYYGGTVSNFVTENNPQENITNNLVEVKIISSVDSLKEAITDGESVVLTADINVGSTTITIPAGKNVTIALNGHNLTGTYEGADPYAMFTIPNGASLTVNGNGEVKAETNVEADNKSLALFQNAGELTLNGGTYNMTNTRNGHTWIIATIVDNRTSNASCAKLTINGGDYSVSGDAINLFRNYSQQGGSATLIINDGSFHANNGNTTYIWNQESGSNQGGMYFNGGIYDADVVYEDYNGQTDIHIAEGVTIQSYSGNN